MPGGDRTGPRGMGPMTGGGRGYCAVPAGRALRRGGRGWRNWYYATGMTGWQRAAYGYPAYGAVPYSPEPTAEEEKEMLKEEAEALKRELADIQDRISSLEKTRSRDENK